jgi:hypothetical protein
MGGSASVAWLLLLLLLLLFLLLRSGLSAASRLDSP